MKIDYEIEVNAYGRNLPPVDKQVARDVFTDLLQMGYDYEWIYFAIMNLGQRDIARHRGLFFYKPFQEEVAAMVIANREAEEEKRRESERICAAIEEQMRQAKKQNVIEVKMKRKKRRIKTAAEVLAEIDNMEDEE